MSDGEVRPVRDGAVATILFDRPQVRNAMTWRMGEGLAAACAELVNNTTGVQMVNLPSQRLTTPANPQSDELRMRVARLEAVACSVTAPG